MRVVLSDIRISLIITLLLVIVLGCLTRISLAQVMQSSNYRIESDSVNFGGGFSSSTNYTLESTGGEVASGNSTSTSYALRAGYQQMTTRFVSITSPASVIMSPTIVGIVGGESDGSTMVTVTTDSAAGYELSIKASASPAMVKDSDSISDYIPSGNPDYTFTTDPTDSHFGYSPSGIDVVDRFKDDGVSVCNAGALETALACWDGLDTVDEVIARGSSGNSPDGATTTVYFKVGIGGSVSQAAGVYVATTTLTAVAL